MIQLKDCHDYERAEYGSFCEKDITSHVLKTKINKMDWYQLCMPHRDSSLRCFFTRHEIIYDDQPHEQMACGIFSSRLRVHDGVDAHGS